MGITRKRGVNFFELDLRGVSAAGAVPNPLFRAFSQIICMSEGNEDSRMTAATNDG